MSFASYGRPGPSPHYDAEMSRSQVERRLREVSERLRQLREELRVADEQLAHLTEEADEARLRSLVSETPLSDREHHDAQRHAEAMQRHRQEVLDTIARLEATQDELLDRLVAQSS
jgi:chromosome segregation ATPase